MTPDQIAIVHGATPSLEELIKFTFPNHEEYAQKHGYTLKTMAIQPSKRHWGKIHALQEILADTRIRRVFWIDADALFTNYTLSLTEHLPDRKIVLAYDFFGPNNGTMWLENCPEVRLLLQAIATKGYKMFVERGWWDQSAYRFFSLHPPYNTIVHYVEPPRMNSSINRLYWGSIMPPGDTWGDWEPGHFILHLYGIPNELRIKTFKEILPLIKK